MTFMVGTGYSNERNPVQAAKAATNIALQRGGIDKPDFVFAFAAAGYSHQTIIDTIRTLTNGAGLFGGSMEGLICKDMIDESSFGLLVTAVKSDEVCFRAVGARGLGTDSAKVGAEIATQLAPHMGPDVVGALTLIDGISGNAEQYFKGIESVLGKDAALPLLGGLAGDAWEFKQTQQFANDQVITDGAACVLISGKLRLVWGVSHGCVPIGTQRTVTKSKGNVIYEIDGKPAAEIVREYLYQGEEWQKASVNICLGFKASDFMKGAYDEYLIRFMLKQNEEDGSIVLQSEVPGSAIWMTRRDFEKMQTANQHLAENLRKDLRGAKPKLVFQFDCAGRGKLMLRDKQRAQMNTQFREDIDPGVPWAGGYVFGEIAPVAAHNCFHNYTTVVAVLC